MPCQAGCNTSINSTIHPLQDRSMDLEQGGAAMKAVDVEASSAAIPTESESRSATGNLLMLMEKSQLQRLALLLRNNEETLMRRVLTSEQERVEYLMTVNNSYNQTMQLLDDCTALRDKYGGDSARSGAARDVHDYVLYDLNLCRQNIRNCCMRVDALGKLREHYDALAGCLADAGADAESLAAQAAEYKASMWEYSYKHRSASGRALSRAYSQVLRMEGVGFPELLRRHQVKLGYGGKQDFEDLGDTEKIEVYNSIIAESGSVPRGQRHGQAREGRGGDDLGAGRKRLHHGGGHHGVGHIHRGVQPRGRPPRQPQRAGDGGGLRRRRRRHRGGHQGRGQRRPRAVRLLSGRLRGRRRGRAYLRHCQRPPD